MTAASVCKFPFHIAVEGVESWDLTLALSPFFYHSCQLYIRSPINTSFISLSSSPLLSFFLPVICILNTAHSISIFYQVCHILFVLFPLLFLSHFLLLFCLSPCSPCSTTLCLCDKLLFAGRELGPSLHCGKCVFFYIWESCAAMVEDIPESFCPTLQHKHTPTKSPLAYLCCVRASSLQQRATLIN